MNGEQESPRTGPEIGRSLQKAREDKGLSLQQVEQETKIRSRYLRDLERENFGVLPAVYILGSLKTYADFLGLDGTALARELRGRAEQDEPEVAAGDGNLQTMDDDYEAAPVIAVGFNQLFLGMGVILISILAIMTLVFAVAQDDGTLVSQMEVPSTDEAPSEIALAGNVNPEPRDARATSDEQNAKQHDKPETPKDDEVEKDRDEKEQQEAPSPATAFDGVKFVPMSPSASPATAVASASATAAPAGSPPATGTTPNVDAPPTPDANTSPEPAPTAPATESSAPATAPPDAAPSSPEPVEAGASSPTPSDGEPGAASVQPAVPAGGGGANASPVPGGGAGQASTPINAADPGRISVEIDRRVEEAFKGAGLSR